METFDIQQIIGLARDAGDAILKVYGKDDFSIVSKDDDSPLTEADRCSHEVIVAGLEKYDPDTPIISEEAKTLPYEERKGWNRFWLIDPLDGTKEFIKRNGEFTVNIALIENGAPIAGVVYRPTTGTTYYNAPGEAAYKLEADGEPTLLEAGTHYNDLDTVRVVASRSHMSDEVTAFVDELKSRGKKIEFTAAGSSLKLCLVAEGAADVYPRLGPTMEWDTGAAHAVVNAAGRRVIRHDNGEALVYNKEDLLNPFFIVE